MISNGKHTAERRELRLLGYGNPPRCILKQYWSDGQNLCAFCRYRGELNYKNQRQRCGEKLAKTVSKSTAAVALAHRKGKEIAEAMLSGTP